MRNHREPVIHTTRPRNHLLNSMDPPNVSNMVPPNSQPVSFLLQGRLSNEEGDTVYTCGKMWMCQHSALSASFLNHNMRFPKHISLKKKLLKSNFRFFHCMTSWQWMSKQNHCGMLFYYCDFILNHYLEQHLIWKTLMFVYLYMHYFTLLSFSCFHPLCIIPSHCTVWTIHLLQ